MLVTIKNYGKMYGFPFLVQYNSENIHTPFRVEICRNGHYFQTEEEAFQYAESQIEEYFRRHNRRKQLR